MKRTGNKRLDGLFLLEQARPVTETVLAQALRAELRVREAFSPESKGFAKRGDEWIKKINRKHYIILEAGPSGTWLFKVVLRRDYGDQIQASGHSPDQHIGHLVDRHTRDFGRKGRESVRESDTVTVKRSGSVHLTKGGRPERVNPGDVFTLVEKRRVGDKIMVKVVYPGTRKLRIATGDLFGITESVQGSGFGRRASERAAKTQQQLYARKAFTTAQRSQAAAQRQDWASARHNAWQSLDNAKLLYDAPASLGEIESTVKGIRSAISALVRGEGDPGVLGLTKKLVALTKALPGSD